MNPHDTHKQVRHWLWLALGVVVLAGLTLLGVMAWGALQGEWLLTSLAGTLLLTVLWRAEAVLDACCRRLHQRAARRKKTSSR